MKKTNKALTKPDSEPVSLALVKIHIAVDHTDDDPLILRQITAARKMCEDYTGKVFGVRTYRMRLSAWPRDGIITFPVEPVVSVDSVKYIDEHGTEQTVSAANWRENLDATPPIVRLITGFSYPFPHIDEPAPITVAYTAGFDAEEIPETLESAVLLIVQYWRDKPGGDTRPRGSSDGMPEGATRLLDMLWTGEM